MLSNLPYPYPDEILFSILQRHMIHNGINNKVAFRENLFGRPSKELNPTIPTFLDLIAQRTYRSWKMSGEDLLMRHTLFPYFAYPISEDIALDIKNYMLKGEKFAKQPIKYFKTGKCTEKCFRFCKCCMEEDLLSHGEAYWHRTHQLPGVMVCPEHGEFLIVCDAPFPLSPQECKSYSESHDKLISQYSDLFSEDCRIKALKIAKRSKEILSGTVPSYYGHNPLSYYRKIIEEESLIKNPLFMVGEIQSEIIRYYGQFLFIYINVSEYSMIHKIIYDDSKNFQTIMHVLMQVFLESDPFNAKDNRFGSGPWKCPNHFCRQKDPLPIKKVHILMKNDRGALAGAMCSCGFLFYFTTACEYDPQLLLPTPKSFHWPP